jgi:hypothetical protein
MRFAECVRVNIELTILLELRVVCRPTLAEVRQSLEELGFGYGTESSQPGKFYEYPGDPLASGVGTPVKHPNPA